MDFSFSREDELFRDKVRTWLAGHAPRERRPQDGPAMREFDLMWQRSKFEGGWAGIAWPTEYGGCGLSPVRQMIWYEECARAGAPSIGCLSIALNHAGPTVMARGTAEQKAFHLQKILSGQVVWCQGFSEPGAGSDLASLRMRADIDGGELVITGQKIWTSHAHLADYQETLVRTDAGGPKHKGITWVIVDMRTPGITVRPIETLVPGYHHFCEVFYDQVRVPLSNVVGPVNEGWRIAMSTLSFERGGSTVSAALDLVRVVEELVTLAAETSGPNGRPVIGNDAIGSRLATHRAEAAALRAMACAAISRAQGDQPPGAESALAFLYFGELLQRVRQTALDILGTASLEITGDPENWVSRFLADRMFVIAGGSTEIRRNIIAEHLLGLPRSY